MSFDFDRTYTVEGYEGIAWRAISHPEITYECDGHPVEPEDDPHASIGEVYYCDGSCREPEPDFDRVIAIMVGDNRRFEFDVDELHAIEEDAYCHECGQIGCGHGRVDVS